MLRELLLQKIAKDLDMKENFLAWCDILRNTARDMEENGNVSQKVGQTPTSDAPFHRKPYS